MSSKKLLLKNNLYVNYKLEIKSHTNVHIVKKKKKKQLTREQGL